MDQAVSGLSKNIVYLVSSEEDGNALIGLGVAIRDGWLSYFDTVRERCFEVSRVFEQNGGVTVVTPNAAYTFRPLTCALYEQAARSRVVGQPKFTSDEQLQRYYLQTFAPYG